MTDVVEAFSVMRMTGAVEDDLKVLVSKGFITVLNEDLVAYIEDWSKNNQIRKDRYQPSIYQNLLVQIGAVNQLETVGQPDGNQRLTQDSIVQVITLPSDSTVPSSDQARIRKADEEGLPAGLGRISGCVLSPRRNRAAIADSIPRRARSSCKHGRTRLTNAIGWTDMIGRRLSGCCYSRQDDRSGKRTSCPGEKFRRQYTALLARMGGG